MNMQTDSSHYLPSLGRGICAANGKGGTLKTSTLANKAGLYALAGYKVLAIDLDPQGDGNLGTDLGYNARGLTDKGRSLAMALAFDNPLNILHDVRPNLDAICGGSELDKAVAALGRMNPSEYRYKLLHILQPHLSRYDMVLIDTPPGNRLLQEIALTTAKYVYIPTRTDSASIVEGVAHIAATFATVKREANPDLTLLGVIVCATTFRGETQRKAKDGTTKTVPPTQRLSNVRAQLTEILGEVAPVYDAHVRYVEAAATDARDGGQLAHELEQEVLSGPTWLEQLRNPELRQQQRLASSQSAGGLAGDYQGIARETLTYITQAEQALTGVPA